MADAEQLLRQTFHNLREKAHMRAAGRAYRQGIDHRTRRCPGCGQGLHLRAIPTVGGLLVCPGCSWTFQLPYEIQEGRLPGEGIIPGVTGVPRGTPTVVLDSSGKIKQILG